MINLLDQHCPILYTIILPNQLFTKEQNLSDLKYLLKFHFLDSHCDTKTAKIIFSKFWGKNFCRRGLSKAAGE